MPRVDRKVETFDSESSTYLTKLQQGKDHSVTLVVGNSTPVRFSGRRPVDEFVAKRIFGDFVDRHSATLDALGRPD